MKILLVEDSATLRYALGGYMREAGHTVLEVTNGEAALAALAEAKPDLIIMDVEMPGLDGFETTRRIRTELGERWIPIIFVTGKDDDDSFQEGIEAGGDDYLTKPVSKVILQAKIRAMARIAEMQEQLSQLNAELEQLSRHDALTGLFNRRAFNQLAQQQWRAAGRERQPITVLMLDVDHFKRYNDHYGHVAGDECLRQVAQVLQENLHRSTDVLARYGGEEFVALLPNTDLAGGHAVGEKFRRAIYQQKLAHAASPIADRVTLSVGVASTKLTTGRHLEDLVALADGALYAAKDQGRNRVVQRELDPPKTVLVVDDDPDTLSLVSYLLDQHTQVRTAYSGVDALTAIESQVPDLILLDIDMPGMDGIEVCQRLRAYPPTAKVPVVFLSFYAQGDKQQAVRTVGADDYLQKPVDEMLLLATINKYLCPQLEQH